MADGSDDDDDPQTEVRHRQMSMHAVLGGLLDTEEFEGAEDDDPAIDDMLADMIGATELDDAIDVVGDDPADESEEGHATSSTAGGGGAGGAGLSLQSPMIRAALERQLWLERIRRTFGFGAAVRLDVVDISDRPAPHAWLTDERWAHMNSESGRVHTAIRDAIDPASSDEAPPMGGGAVYTVPSSIEAMRLPRWAAIAPRLSASNTVTTMHTNVEPNQMALALNHASTTFNPCSFAAVKLKRKYTCLVFRSGAAVIAGPPGHRPALNAALDFTLMLQRMDMMPFEPICKLQNIVSNAACFPIDLDLLVARYPVNARYEVTRFPGLVFHFGYGRAWVFIIFPSGNVIGTGFASWLDVNIAWRWLFSHVLVEFKDSKAAGRESAAEKKNRVYNNDSIFAATLRTIQLVGFKRTYARMLRDEPGADAEPDLAAAWREILTMPAR